MLKLIYDTISKNPNVFKIVLEKIFEILLYHQIVSPKTTLLLMPLLNHYFAKKQGSKKNSIWHIGLSGFLIVLILLAESIAT